MKHTTMKAIGALTLALTLSSTANAALVETLNGQAYYDTESGLTWQANANLALTNQFGLTLSTIQQDDTINTVGSNGRMTFNNAVAWIAGMNDANYLGFNDWRLPTIMPLNGDTFDTEFSKDGSTDIGFNISRSGTLNAGSYASEMAYLYYNTMGNVSPYDAVGEFEAACFRTCAINTFPLFNLDTFFPSSYWVGLEYSVSTDKAWNFHFRDGAQGYADKNNHFSAMAVRGDIPSSTASVPEPPMLLLLGAAFIGLVGRKYKR